MSERESTDWEFETEFVDAFESDLATALAAA